MILFKRLGFSEFGQLDAQSDRSLLVFRFLFSSNISSRILALAFLTPLNMYVDHPTSHFRMLANREHHF